MQGPVPVPWDPDLSRRRLRKLLSPPGAPQGPLLIHLFSPERSTVGALGTLEAVWRVFPGEWKGKASSMAPCRFPRPPLRARVLCRGWPASAYVGADPRVVSTR